MGHLKVGGTRYIPVVAGVNIENEVGISAHLSWDALRTLRETVENLSNIPQGTLIISDRDPERYGVWLSLGHDEWTTFNQAVGFSRPSADLEEAGRWAILHLPVPPVRHFPGDFIEDANQIPNLPDGTIARGTDRKLFKKATDNFWEHPDLREVRQDSEMPAPLELLHLPSVN